jgi:hypothetical protein
MSLPISFQSALTVRAAPLRIAVLTPQLPEGAVKSLLFWRTSCRVFRLARKGRTGEKLP